jgi:5-(carboxyamino)imidazole ribonucleotide synthase
MSHIISPGSALGILGSGQLGRMLALAARRMGYRVHVFSPERDSPTGQVADVEVVGAYADVEAVRAFAQEVSVVTFEFENVPAPTAAACAECAPVRPSGSVLHLTQNRLREKTFLAGKGLPVAPFHPVNSLDDLQAGLTQLGLPAVLKTAAFGYDGKGQHLITNNAEANTAWQSLKQQALILEAFIDFDREASVVAARGLDGRFAHYGVIENIHRNHILDVSIAPAPLSAELTTEAIEIARCVLEKLEVVGVFCVEFFLTRDSHWLINELAPRPHNSGHLTIEACVTSQFEQQVRAVCGLPLGATEYVRPAAMANLLGDLWLASHGEPDWAAACTIPDVKLHLYGKSRPRPGRKMGHLTALGHTVEEARQKILTARDALIRA